MGRSLSGSKSATNGSSGRKIASQAPTSYSLTRTGLSLRATATVPPRQAIINVLFSRSYKSLLREHPNHLGHNNTKWHDIARAFAIPCAGRRDV